MDILESDFKVRLLSACFLVSVASMIVALGSYYYFALLVLIVMVVIAEFIRAVVIEYGDSNVHFKKYVKYAVICTGIPFISMLGIRNMFNCGLKLTLWTVIVISVFDSMAYLVGRRFGRTKIFTISPSKTLEGTIGGIFSAVIAGVLFAMFAGVKIGLLPVVVLCIIMAILAQAGDLLESSFKRKFYLKNSSELIPGHGGFMDRFDGYFFVSPFVFVVSLCLKMFLHLEVFV